MYSIGQFSRITSLPVASLKFFNNEDLLKPAHVDPKTGCFYYNAEQITIANVLRVLEKMQLPIIAAKKVVAGGGGLSAGLETLSAELKAKICKYQEALAQVEQLLARGMERPSGNTYMIKCKDLPAMTVVASRQTAPLSSIIEVIDSLYTKVEQNELEVVGPMFTRYYDGDFNPTLTDFEVCIPVAGTAPSLVTISEHQVLYTVHVGPYERVGAAYRRLLDECYYSGLCFAGPFAEVYLLGGETTEDQSEWLTEIQIPVAATEVIAKEQLMVIEDTRINYPSYHCPMDEDLFMD